MTSRTSRRSSSRTRTGAGCWRPAAARGPHGQIAAGASISNRLTLTTDWTRSSPDVAAGADFQQWRAPNAPTGIADHRLAATAAVVRTGDQTTPRDIVAGLRHHGSRPWGAPGADAGDVSLPPTEVGDDWSGVTVCMHVRDYQVTTASIVAEIARRRRARARVGRARQPVCERVRPRVRARGRGAAGRRTRVAPLRRACASASRTRPTATRSSRSAPSSRRWRPSCGSRPMRCSRTATAAHWKSSPAPHTPPSPTPSPSWACSNTTGASFNHHFGG